MDREIENLHQAHPEEMYDLYVHYGLPKAELNVQTTKDLATVYGDEFLYDLHLALGYEGESFFGKKIVTRKDGTSRFSKKTPRVHSASSKKENRHLFKKKDHAKNEKVNFFNPSGADDDHEYSQETGHDTGSGDGTGDENTFLSKLKDYGSAVTQGAASDGDQGNGKSGEEGYGNPPSIGEIFGMSKPLFYGLVAVALIILVYAVSQSKKSVTV